MVALEHNLEVKLVEWCDLYPSGEFNETGHKFIALHGERNWTTKEWFFICNVSQPPFKYK